MNLLEERTIALAAIMQAAKQVQNLARKGRAETEYAEPMMRSILVLDAVNTPAVYGGLANLKQGLEMIAGGILTSSEGDQIEILRYVMALLHLEHQLMRDSQRFEAFASDVERLSAQESSELTDACSDVYQKYISNIKPQIIVQGEQDYLQNSDIPPQVRTMLLAGIRSAVLWEQKRGGRFKLLWERTRMQNAAKILIRVEE